VLRSSSKAEKQDTYSLSEESDKEKVETLKSELTELHASMKSSWEAWDSFNEKMLGVSPEVDEEP
jgi:hypothetical protein